jgi:hypothetical protein
MDRRGNECTPPLRFEPGDLSAGPNHSGFNRISRFFEPVSRPEVRSFEAGAISHDNEESFQRILQMLRAFSGLDLRQYCPCRSQCSMRTARLNCQYRVSRPNRAARKCKVRAETHTQCACCGASTRCRSSPARVGRFQSNKPAADPPALVA